MKGKIKNIKMATQIKLKFNNQPVKVAKYFGKLPKDLYPYWYWELKDDRGNTFDFYPSWQNLLSILTQSLAHEKKMDLIMGRKSEFQKWYSFTRRITDIAKNNKLLEEYNEK